MPSQAQPSKEPLLRYLNVQIENDDAMRQLLRDAAKESERIAQTAGDVRKAQLALARQQQELWRSVGWSVEAGITQSVSAAGDSLAFLNEVMLNSVGGSSAFWRQAMLQQARSGIDSVISRGATGVPLSQRVYKARAWSNDLINRKINGLLLSGASPREIAKSVRGLIDPAVPGGVSYAAMRLGRTELNNAFHTTAVRVAGEQPWTTGMKWHLSSSHPEGDVCDDYAFDSHYKGGEAGVFKTTQVPGKPHPQCLCYVTPVVDDDDIIAKRFANGEYDEYLGLSGCTSG